MNARWAEVPHWYWGNLWMCMCFWTEGVLSAALVAFCLCQPEGRMGHGCLWVLFMAISVSVQVSVCLWDIAQLLYWFNFPMGRQQLKPLGWAEPHMSKADFSREGQRRHRLELLQTMDTCNIPQYWQSVNLLQFLHQHSRQL